jgi:hypothetical protein
MGKYVLAVAGIAAGTGLLFAGLTYGVLALNAWKQERNEFWSNA